MNSHIPFDADNDWTLDPYHCNHSNDPLVDKVIGNAYAVVRAVYCNLGNLKMLYDFLNTYGMVLGVKSEAELKNLNKLAKYARVYGFANTGDRQVTDYLYVPDDTSGIRPNDPTATGSWIKVSTSGSGSGGTGVGNSYIPYVYANGSALGGETSFKVPAEALGVPFIIINGSVKYIGYGFSFNPANSTVTLSNPLVRGDEVIALTSAAPASPDNPNVSNWVQVNWLYNNGAAVGGEQVITVPYNFKDVPAVYKNGERYYKNLQTKSYVYDPSTRTVTMTELLAQGDRVIITLGGESTSIAITDRTTEEVARANNVKDTDVVLSSSTNVVITDKKVLYDVNAQKYWDLPNLPPNVYIVKVEGNKLTYNPGAVVIDLLEPANPLTIIEPVLSRLGAETGNPMVGTFEKGASVSSASQTVGSTMEGKLYRWEGTLPKTVRAGDTPYSSGGVGSGKWVEITNATLRSQLASTGGAAMVKASDGRTVEQWLVQSDSASFRAKNMAKLAWCDYQVHNRGSLKCCFLGDSMTAGFDRTSSDAIPAQDGDWATRASMNYPYRFASYLPEQSGCSVAITMRAISGHTAKQAYEQAEWQTNPNCDIVFIMYAINDSGGVAGATLDIYMEYMEKLIRRYIDWGCAVVVQRPSGGGQGAGNPAWLHWAKRMQMVARVYGCPVFDAHEVMLNRHYAAVQSDGTHYNSMGYAIHGEKLASMLMAGGLLDTYKPVVNETTVWTGMMSDHIGWCDARGNINTGRSDGAYTRDKVTGVLQAGKASICTFSFYLDAEAAHIYGKLDGLINTIYTNGHWWNNENKPYYKYASDIDNSFGASLQRTVKTPNNYEGMSGSRKFVGRLIGRGWHTITLFTNLRGEALKDAFVNSITVQPIPIGLSTEQMWGQDEERRYRVVHTRRLPSPSGQGGNLPTAVTLTGFQMRAPQSFLGTGPGTYSVPAPYFYNTVPGKLKVYNEKGDYIEWLIYKDGSSGLKWKGKVLTHSFADAASVPTLTAYMGTAKQSVVVAAGSSGANQPLENIYDYNGGLQEQTGVPANDLSWKGGIYLVFTLAWPTTAPTGYWTMELEGSDWFGNSESSVGCF